jgi:hypothetical protein
MQKFAHVALRRPGRGCSWQTALFKCLSLFITFGPHLLLISPVPAQ